MLDADKSKPSGEDLRNQHAVAIGKIVMAWNDYQEMLGEIFANLFARRDWSLALSAWHALENDRAQRAMLAAVASRKFKSTGRAYREIIWMVEKSNQIISDQRNSGIHTPLILFTEAGGVQQMVPHALFGNRRAAKLYGSNLMLEFLHYEIQIRKMFSFAVAVRFATAPRKLRRGRVTWPKRPQLLSRAPQQPPKP